MMCRPHPGRKSPPTSSMRGSSGSAFTVTGQVGVRVVGDALDRGQPGIPHPWRLDDVAAGSELHRVVAGEERVDLGRTPLERCRIGADRVAVVVVLAEEPVHDAVRGRPVRGVADDAAGLAGRATGGHVLEVGADVLSRWSVHAAADEEGRHQLLPEPGVLVDLVADHPTEKARTLGVPDEHGGTPLVPLAQVVRERFDDVVVGEIAVGLLRVRDRSERGLAVQRGVDPAGLTESGELVGGDVLLGAVVVVVEVGPAQPPAVDRIEVAAKGRGVPSLRSIVGGDRRGGGRRRGGRRRLDVGGRRSVGRGGPPASSTVSPSEQAAVTRARTTSTEIIRRRIEPSSRIRADAGQRTRTIEPAGCLTPSGFT